MTNTGNIKIAIVDDHTLFRKGVVALLAELGELDVLFEAENGLQLQQLVDKNNLPDIILMDINMMQMDGYQATEWLTMHYPSVKVLALSMFEDDIAIIKMLKAGAKGYVLKESKPRDLLAAITSVHEQGIYINELVSRKLMRSVKDGDGQPPLTEREREFMRLCCSELTYKEIADKMFVSPRTVDNYRESLFLKLNLRSRTGIVLYAIQMQIFKLKTTF